MKKRPIRQAAARREGPGWSLGAPGLRIVCALLFAGPAAGGAESGATATVLRVNCGGMAVTNVAGSRFEADAPYTDERGWGYEGGRVSEAAADAVTAGTASPELYRTDRWGLKAYRFRVQPGLYRVTCHLAEHYFREPNRRIFDVLLNGRAVASSVDLVGQVGPKTVLLITALADAAGGEIVVSTRDLVDKGKFCAIEVEPAVPDADAPPPPAGVRVHPRGGVVGVEWDAPADDEVRGYQLWRRVDGDEAFVPVGGLVESTYALDGEAGNGVARAYRVTAVDYFGRASVPSAVAEVPPGSRSSPPLAHAIDVGRPEAEEGAAWSADRAYNPAAGAGWVDRGVVVTNEAAAGSPWSRGREGSWSYRFDVPAGTYRVTLGIFERAGAVAYDRVFDVWLNDFLAWPDLDVAAQFGAGHPVSLERMALVTTNGLVVRASRRHGLPLLSALRVEAVSPDETPPAEPAFVSVEARDEVVHLQWPPVGEPDVAGYRVWRAEDPAGPFEPVAGSLIGRARYVDRSVRNGRRYVYQVAAVDAGGREGPRATSGEARPEPPDDDRLLDLISRAAFQYFAEECDPRTFLTRDKNTAPEISVAAVGFGLSALVVGAERGWMARAEAERRVVTMLSALERHPNNRHRGVFFHYLNPDGSHTAGGYEDGASTVDTALLLWGALTAGEYFGGPAREIAQRLLEGADWRAFAHEPLKMMTMIYRPSNGTFDGLWNYYTDEALLIALLGIGTPRAEHRLEPAYFYGFTRARRGYQDIPDLVYTWPGALFTYTFAHVWVDFRALGPDQPAALGLPADLQVDWWENTVRAVRANRAYCIRQGGRFRTFGEHAWGLTASSGPGDTYNVGGAPPCGDAPNPGGGTLALYGAGMAVPFLPAEALAALRHYYTFQDATGRKRLWRDEFDGGYGLIDAFNVDLDWFSQEVQAINHGPMLLLIENHRSGLLWRVTMRHPLVREALQRVGWTLPPPPGG